MLEEKIRELFSPDKTVRQRVSIAALVLVFVCCLCSLVPVGW
jgi:hypothetical protein